VYIVLKIKQYILHGKKFEIWRRSLIGIRQYFILFFFYVHGTVQP